MNSSALLEETTQMEMDNPRKEQEELNLNELNSFLNSIMNKCRSKIFYCRQAQGICNTWECVIKNNGKIVLHLLFGWSLDKDQKSLDQSKQIYALTKFKL